MVFWRCCAAVWKRACIAMHADGAEESRLELASLESRTAAAEADARDFFEPIMYQLVDGHCVTFAVGSTVPLNNSTPRAQFLSREAACLHEDEEDEEKQQPQQQPQSERRQQHRGCARRRASAAATTTTTTTTYR